MANKLLKLLLDDNLPWPSGYFALCCKQPTTPGYLSTNTFQNGKSCNTGNNLVGPGLADLVWAAESCWIIFRLGLVKNKYSLPWNNWPTN